MHDLIAEIIQRPLKPCPLDLHRQARLSFMHRQLSPMCADPDRHITTREGRLAWLAANGQLTLEEQEAVSRQLHEEQRGRDLDKLKERIADQQVVQDALAPLAEADKAIWNAIVAQKRALGHFCTPEQLGGVLLEAAINKNDELGRPLNASDLEDKVQRAIGGPVNGQEWAERRIRGGAHG